MHEPQGAAPVSKKTMPAKRDWDEVEDPDVLRDEIFRLQGELEKAKKRVKVAETSVGSSGATSGRAAPAVTEALIEKTKAALIKQIRAQIPSNFKVSRWGKTYRGPSGRVTVEQVNVPLELIKAIFGPKLKGMSVRDFKAALGNPDFTKRKVNWGHHHEIGLKGSVTVTHKSGSLRVSGKYGPYGDEEDEEEERGVGRPSMASFYASSPEEVTGPVPPPVAAEADSDSDWTPDNQECLPL